MSWGRAKTPTQAPSAAGIQSEDVASNEQAVPVPYWGGPDWRPLTWIVAEPYNVVTKEIRQKAGKGGDTVTGHEVWVDVAGIAGLGLGRRIRALEIGNEVVWTGTISRPDNPLHPDYWRGTVIVPQASAYIYWGRRDQPVDDILLGPIGEADPALAHPAYRHQILVVLKRLYCGSSASSVPSVRVLIEREPVPEIGNFPAQDSAQGESIIACELELATNPIFGAGMPASRFTAAQWEALSGEVIARIGCHAPSLDRARTLRDVLRDFAEYYDGWKRIEAGKIVPGMFPHDGTIPAGLTELSVHDFVEEPSLTTKTPARAMNDLTVMVRDGSDMLKKTPVSASDAASVEARRQHESQTVEMPGIIDLEQASRFAQEAASTGAELEAEGEIKVRKARAIWADGSRLRAGDNFNLDYLQLELDQVSRITRRTDPYRGSPSLEFVAERGVWPTPYAPPADLRPTAGKIIPDVIAAARVLELTPDLAGTPLGLPVGFLAKRPASQHEDAALTAANVLGFNVWYSPDGGSYDSLGAMPSWAMRGTLREALANAAGDVTVKLAMDADNLDLSRLAAQTAAGQLNDNLLVVVGEELFSVGAIALAGLNYDLTCKRVRLGSLPAAHSIGDEAWVFWRDELRGFTHRGFVEDQTRYFKLQPYTQSATLELADITALVYHFRDRAPEAPVIVFTELPGGGAVAGINYNVRGSISDVNGDLVRYEVAALLYDGADVLSEIALLTAAVPDADAALFNFRTRVAFPQPGTWKIRARAWDVTGAMTELLSAGMVIVAGTGRFGPDDGVTPDALNIADVTITSGVEQLILRWTYTPNTPVELIEVYESATAVRPAAPKYPAVLWPQNWLFAQDIAEGSTRYYWFRVKGVNQRWSAFSGPKTGTVLTWPRISGLESDLADVAAEWVAKIAYNSGGQPRVAGFRVTAFGGGDAAGSSEIVLQADKVGIVNAAGDNQRAPFAVVGGVVYLDTALIRDATILSAMIDTLVADKISAGDLLAMVLLAAKTATDSVFFNVADRGRTMPATAFQQAEDGTHVTGLASTPLERSLVSFEGWLAGAGGYSEARFGKSTMRFVCSHNGGSTVAVGKWIDLKISYRINGGAWVDVTPFSARALDSNGALNLSGGCIISGLVGTDVIEFGVRVNALDDVSQLNVTNLAVTAHNV